VVLYRFARSLSLLGVAVSWLFWEGIGIWGPQPARRLGVGHHNFVFWVGIGHAGTLISAIIPVPPDLAHLDQPLGRGH
jgi:hypothetical protein